MGAFSLIVVINLLNRLKMVKSDTINQKCQKTNKLCKCNVAGCDRSFAYPYLLKQHLRRHENVQQNFGQQNFIQMYRLKQKYANNIRAKKFINQKDSLLLVNCDDPSLCTLGSEETHNLHQSVFESLQQSGHDYTSRESESDFREGISLNMENSLESEMELEPDYFLQSERLFDDTHNYALCSEEVFNHSIQSFKQRSTSEVTKSKLSESQSIVRKDHECYSSSSSIE